MRRFGNIEIVYSGTCIIRHSFGEEKPVGLTNCRIDRKCIVKRSFVQRFCRIKIIPVYTSVGLGTFHCIICCPSINASMVQLMKALGYGQMNPNIFWQMNPNIFFRRVYCDIK